jgi:outer membrane cobalamin receptor
MFPLTLRARLARACTVAALVATTAGAVGAAPSKDDPFALVREEQIVTGASKRPQPVSETPSAVTVITAEEIRTHGYRTLAEALRWARGMFTSYDRNYAYVGVRGLLRPGDYNNKVLLTIDGHSMNGNVYGDALFGSELGLDMELVDRIEIVRGPGSALYGSNAVLAVVNVVTRKPHSDQGLQLGARTGGFGGRRGFGSFASARPGQPEWMLSGSWLDVGGADLYFAEFDDPLTNGGMANSADGERAFSLFGAAEWAGLRLAVKFNDRTKHIPTGSFGTSFNDARSLTIDGHDFVELSGSRRPSTALEVTGRAYWDGSRYRGTYVYDSGSGPYLNSDRGDGDVLGTEWRANWTPGTGHVVTAGLEGQAHIRALQQNYDVEPRVDYLNKDVHSTLGALYVQDEVQFENSLRITGGARVDRYPRFDPVVSPRVDLVWGVGSSTTVKVLAGSSFRAPTAYEAEYESPWQTPNPLLQPERVGSIEATLERSEGPLTATLTGYRNVVRDLIDLTDTGSGLQFGNRERVRGHGVETEMQWVAGPGTRGRIGLAWQQSVDLSTGAELSNSPRWNAHAMLTQTTKDEHITTGLGVRYLSPRYTLAGARTADAVIADVRIGSRLQNGLHAGIECRNLFDKRYGDPGSTEHPEDQIVQDRRTLYATLSFRPNPLR